MKKLFALAALTGLVAAGCTTDNYQGGAYDNYETYNRGVYGDGIYNDDMPPIDRPLSSGGADDGEGAFDTRESEFDASYGYDAPNTKGPGTVPGGYGSAEIEPNTSSNSRP